MTDENAPRRPIAEEIAEAAEREEIDLNLAAIERQMLRDHAEALVKRAAELGSAIFNRLAGELQEASHGASRLASPRLAHDLLTTGRHPRAQDDTRRHRRHVDRDLVRSRSNPRIRWPKGRGSSSLSSRTSSDLQIFSSNLSECLHVISLCRPWELNRAEQLPP
jgi:hypothetical protein